MKSVLPILLLIVAATQSLFAQTTTLTFPFVSSGSGEVRQQNVEVLAGETFEVLMWVSDGASLKVDGLDLQAHDPSKKVVVAGPKAVELRVSGQRYLGVTYRLTTDSPAATQNVASRAVVIPENASAPADVIFESSTDLINWTAAIAGSYAPSTSKRFFRVRLVTH